MNIHPWAVAGGVALLLSACTSSPKISPPRNGPFAALSASQIYVEKGVKYMESGHYDVALDDLKRAVDLDGSNSEAYNALGVLYQRLEDYPNAESSFRKALSVQPDNFGARNNYGRFLCARNRQAEAFEEFNKVIGNKLYNQPWIPLTNAGVCAHGAGQRDPAEDYLRRALEADPNFAPALLEMAKLSEETRQHLSARAFLQRYFGAAAPTAGSLWLGIEIETALGNTQGAQEYAESLMSRFPDSKEAAQARHRFPQ